MVSCSVEVRRAGSPRLLRLALAAACLAVAALALAGSPARAAGEYELSASFGLFLRPEAVAVDRANHEEYVIDTEAETIKRFDATGAPANFAASRSYINKNELSGTPAGAFSFDSAGAGGGRVVHN